MYSHHSISLLKFICYFLLFRVSLTLKLYGLIKISAIPSPITRMIHSSKLAGALLANALATFASEISSKNGWVKFVLWD